MKRISLFFSKILLLGLGCAMLFSFTEWEPDFNTALQKARAKHQLVLLNFSGSDWCGPCIRMKKEILETTVFSAMAADYLVLVNADFPRSKKNQLAKEQQKQNDALAEKYNPEGKFPFTLLLDENGKIVKTWDGLPDEDAETFTNKVKNICDAFAAK